MYERTEEIFNCAAEKTFYYCHEFHDLNYIFRYNEKFKTDWREYTDSDELNFLEYMSNNSYGGSDEFNTALDKKIKQLENKIKSAK